MSSCASCTDHLIVLGSGGAAGSEYRCGRSTEWTGRGVWVNCILPAPVKGANGLGPRMEVDPWLRETFLRGIRAGRFGQPDNIKDLSVLLALDAGDWITGAIIPIDVGNLAMNGGGGLLAPIIETQGAKQ